MPGIANPQEALQGDPAEAEIAKEDTAREATPQEPKTENEPFTNTLRWKTASEQDNFGYDIFRADSEDGPFEQINTELIEGAFDSDEENAYSYTDTTIDPTKAYWYYVESISMSGVRERFTPILPAKAKLPKSSP